MVAKYGEEFDFVQSLFEDENIGSMLLSSNSAVLPNSINNEERKEGEDRVDFETLHNFD